MARDTAWIRKLLMLGTCTSALTLPLGAWADEPAVLPADLTAEQLPVAEATESGDEVAEVEVNEATSELIQERFPSGAVKIERRVAQDKDGNYLNHGPWKMWDEKGTLLAEGEYTNGQREGVWNRWYRAGEAELFGQAPFNQYEGPFVSQANFHQGKLHGAWTIFDAKQRKICHFEFTDGLRHGKQTWWFASGQMMREIQYDHGLVEGAWTEWRPDATIVVKDTFQQGRRLAPKVAYYEGDRKKTEGMYLHAQHVVETPDDWWRAKLAAYKATGKDQRHGPWTSWYANGQVQLEGEFVNDIESGKFTWWYQNGQKSLEGFYKDGKQHGRWSWWHQNGQKSSQGDFLAGHQQGRWFWWQENGKVAKAADYGDGQHGEESVAGLPKGPEVEGSPIREDNSSSRLRF
ncbi:MAG: hypothetical protein KF708_14730 [Pirellulales bacterium]|nr:hypothetical protein [Pirellulales bacterium]